MDEDLLCSDCAKDKNLVTYINNHGYAGKCSLCVRQRLRVASTSQLANLFKALIRYHYNEWAYNPHFGGDDPSTLLHQENPIIKTSNIGVAEAADPSFNFDNFIEALTSPVYPDSPETDNSGVWIYRGSDADGRNLYPESLQERRDPRVRALSNYLAHTNYYELEVFWKDLLATHLQRIEKTISVDDEYYRARIGVEEERLKQLPTQEWQQVVVPHIGDKIAPPPQFRATAGRLNRQNIAYLYVATDSSTALAEVRPHPGHFVSLGRFRATREIKVVDLANVVLWPFALNDEALDMFVLLRTIEHAFATPVTPGDEVGYLATQFLADVIRQSGYAGVTYRSSVTKGTNLTVFEPSAFEYVAGSASARKVKGVEYEHVPVPTETAKDPQARYLPPS